MFFSYEFFLCIAISVGIGLFYKEAQQKPSAPLLPKTWTFVLFCIGLLFAAYGGARMLHDFVQFKNGHADIFFSQDRDRGLVFYGGFLGILFMSVASALILKIKVGALLDSLVFPLCIAHAIGRIGCFVRGCCYGDVCDLPWAVTHWTHHIPTSRHPVQLYESTLLVLMAYYFSNSPSLQNGQRFARYLWLYAGCRFLLEFVRDDAIRGVFNHLSTSQWLAAIFFFVGMSADRYLTSHAHAPSRN